MKRFLRLWCYTIAEIAIASFSLLLVAYMFMGSYICGYWIMTLPIYSLFGLTLRKLLKEKFLLQILIGIPLCIASTVATLRLMQLEDSFMFGGLAVGLIVAGILFFRARKFWEADWCDLLPSFIPLYIMVLNFAVLFVVALAPPFEPVRPFVTAFGPFVIIINLLTMNTLNLRSVTEAGEHSTIKNKVTASKGIGALNKMLLIGTFILMLLLSLWDKLLDIFSWCVSHIVSAILAILSFIFLEQKEISGEASAGGGDGPYTIFEEEVTRNPFWEEVTQKAIMVIAIIGVIAFVIYISVKLYKLIKRMIPIIKEYLKRYGVYEESNDEYKDTKERLVDLKDLPKTYLKNVTDWLSERLKREANWNELTSIEEKVRFLYRRAVLKGMAKGTLFDKSKTPSETVDGLTPTITTEEIGALLKTYYNNVRYGGRLPTETEVNELYRKLSA